MNTSDEIMALANELAHARVLRVLAPPSDMKNYLEDVGSAYAALRAAVEAVVRDAERYRWLREQAARGTFGGVVTDAAIDAARNANG